MYIAPYVGDKQLTASSVTVRVDPEDRIRVGELLERTETIQLVNDPETFSYAKRMAGAAKAMLDEIEASKKSAKQPFTQVGRAIDELAVEVGAPLVAEHKRILGLLNNYVAQLERQQKEAEAKKREAQRLIDEANQRKLAEAEFKLAEARLEARQATDEAVRLRAANDAANRLLALAEAKLEQEMDAAIAAIGADKPKPGLVPGGRVDHPWKFELTDVLKTIEAGRLRLLSWKLDIRACQDSVKGQLESDPTCTPSLPGIRCWQEINVSVRAAAKIE